MSQVLQNTEAALQLADSYDVSKLRAFRAFLLAIPQKKGSIYQIYDVFFLHWLEREYW